ncbi:Rho GTPase activation protein [Lactarius indigo]|nr:Rho GTPase activation protein [Lactarius indigo]
MSFMSREPQPKEALENQTKSFLTLFDSHLKIIADRYLAFFQKRRRIEEEYITSLRKLHREANVVDSSFDPRTEPTTTRVAWNQIRDGLEREASTREAFANSLEVDVIKPLAGLKDTGDQTRKRLEMNLRNSAGDYVNHAENTISKLQQAYLKKYPPVDRARSTGPQRASDKKFHLFSKSKQEPEPEESSLEDDCRKAVRQLNIFRSTRAENLEEGYNCLEDLVFRTTVKGVLAKYLDDMVTASKTYHDMAMSAKPGVWRALNGRDESNLTGSFRRAFSNSVPPLTLYRNYRSNGNSKLIFGVPLVDHTANQYYVPKVIGMCIAEVEKRGLNANKIYLSGSINSTEVLQLRRRIESEETFSFSSSDNIYSVAMLLELYLWDLPEPLLRLSLRDYRQYGQNKARYIENDFSLLRSVIRELPPVHRETLGELSRHLALVASHSEQNGMTARALASQFCYAVFRGHTIVEGYVYLKDSLMEDLIQNAHTLFDEPFSPPPPPSAHAGSRYSTISYSSLFSSTLFAEPQAIGPEGSASARSSSTIFLSASSVELSTPPGLPNTLPSPLMGFSPLDTPTDGRDTLGPEQVIPEQLSQQGSYLQARTIHHSPQNSLRSSSAFHPASSATSLQSGMRTFLPTL